MRILTSWTWCSLEKFGKEQSEPKHPTMPQLVIMCSLMQPRVKADIRTASILFAQGIFAETASKCCLVVLSLSFFVKILSGLSVKSIGA